MKKKILSFTFLFISFCIFSTSTLFAQTAPGGSGDGGAGLPAGGPSVPALTIDLGSEGIVSIAPTSPYYSIIKYLLISVNATIAADGTVTFSSVTSYKNCLQPLYYTGCIKRETYQNCKSQTQPPPSCYKKEKENEKEKEKEEEQKKKCSKS